jgi:hypothetical protein
VNFTVDHEELEPIFKARTFVILGFEADDEAFKMLSELVTENGGKITRARVCVQKSISGLNVVLKFVVCKL